MREELIVYSCNWCGAKTEPVAEAVVSTGHVVSLGWKTIHSDDQLVPSRHLCQKCVEKLRMALR